MPHKFLLIIVKELVVFLIYSLDFSEQQKIMMCDLVPFDYDLATNLRCDEDNAVHEILAECRSGFFFLRSRVSFVPNVTSPYVDRDNGMRFLQVLVDVHKEAGYQVTLTKLPEDNKNIVPNLFPTHRIGYDTFKQLSQGVVEPIFQSPKTKEHTPEMRIVYAMGHKCAKLTTAALTSWRCKYNLDVQLVVQMEVYDLRATKFLLRNNKRAWAIERTLARIMARDQQIRAGVREKRYKGVRWRPERKHPWVAELKLPKAKKLWIGNFDTPQEAAQAYVEVAAIYQQKKSKVNLDDDFVLLRMSHIKNPEGVIAKATDIQRNGDQGEYSKDLTGARVENCNFPNSSPSSLTIGQEQHSHCHTLLSPQMQASRRSNDIAKNDFAVLYDAPPFVHSSHKSLDGAMSNLYQRDNIVSLYELCKSSTWFTTTSNIHTIMNYSTFCGDSLRLWDNGDFVHMRRASNGSA